MIPTTKICFNTSETQRFCISVFQFPAWYYAYVPYMPDPPPIIEGNGVDPVAAKDLGLLIACRELASALASKGAGGLMESIDRELDSVRSTLVEGVEIEVEFDAR